MTKSKLALHFNYWCVQVIEEYIKPAKTHVKQPGFYRYIEKTAEELDDEVEYDMDDQVFAIG